MANIQDMRGKVCLVTGATDGIGEVTARELARMGATVIGVGRNPDKMARVQRAMQQATGGDSVEFLRADLSSQADVRALADEFRRSHDRLDVLVNNAGALFKSRRETVDGLEMTFALNHLAYFLLTLLLLDVLKASAPARIVNVASSMQHRPDLDDPQMTDHYDGWDAYGRSKYMNVLFTVELARRLEGTGVTANALNPGYTATNFHRAAGLNMKGHLSPEEGARTQIYLATSAEVSGVSGQYFDSQRPARSAALDDPDAARWLWELSEQLTGLDRS
jgi:NAD(P)-dependent dehydrogenase (short-subunit alcohol dehydrogenase family)